MIEQVAVGRDEIRDAWERISSHVLRTPVLDLAAGSFGSRARITLKLELLQHTGSFKPRGAFSKLLASEVPASGVIAASGGNFGLAVAYAAGTLGHDAEIFVPATSPRAKIERVREQGAAVRVIEGYYDDAAAACRQRAAETGALVMHPFDQPEVVAGQGTIGMELSDQVPDADSVLVAVGGGGLIAGIAAWLQGDARVVAVEPQTSRCLGAALRAGEPVEVPVGGIAADSLGTRRVGEIAFAIAVRSSIQAVTVTDEAIRHAQRALWRERSLIAEPGGAAALAAILSGAYRPRSGERVVVLVCGANCDPATVTGGPRRSGSDR